MIEFSDLMKVIKLNNAQYDEAKIKKAYAVAEEAHHDQIRLTGEPYIVHPLEVAMTLADLGMDTDSIAAALLHDVVEDTPTTLEDIRKQFGEDIARLVDGMTKLGKIPLSSREEQQAENLRKMLIAMANDVRVIIIKLADRLHNMRTLEVKKDIRRRETALETMEVFAPIAHRLGIRAIKEELEDLSLQYLDPVGYHEIEDLLERKKDERNRLLDTIKKRITGRLDGKYHDIQISGRVKSIYGIYRKMYMQGRAFDEIYDIYAIRVIVGNDDDCYKVLGEIHDMFQPIPNRFKDYISTPKANRYQSLHTTVLDKEAVPFEVQIRTREMHHTAEYGIAAHWKYKEGITGKGGSLDDKVAWVSQLIEAQKDTDDAQEILGLIKSDISTDEVFVFTPKGDVISLPTGATVIDFAYAIHSEVGNHMSGAKIDGRMVSLDTKVQTGMIIDVLTNSSPDHGPSRDWLNIVRTSSARNKIRSWFKKERREENIQQGREGLLREMRRYNLHLEEDQREDFFQKIAKSQRLNSVEDFFAAIGFGGIALSSLMPKVKEMYMRMYKTTGEEQIKKQLQKSAAQRPRKASSGVIVEGLDSVLIKFSKCCNPLPGDEIIGYVTRGFGVSIHKKDCINVVGSLDDPNQQERWLKCEWAENTKGEIFKSTVDIFGKDRSGLLVDVSIALNNMRVPVYSLTAKELPEDETSIQITFGASDLGQLTHIMSSLRKIRGVERVERSVQ